MRRAVAGGPFDDGRLRLTRLSDLVCLESEAEQGTAFREIFYVHSAAMLAHDLVDDSQAETGATLIGLSTRRRFPIRL